MGNTYTVPRSAKGESRILYIFTIKSLAISLGFAAIGGLPFLILKSMGHTVAGAIVMVIFALIGYGLAMLNIPDAPIMGKLRKAGGENLWDILVRTITFRNRKKIYLYRKDGMKKWGVKQ